MEGHVDGAVIGGDVHQVTAAADVAQPGQRVRPPGDERLSVLDNIKVTVPLHQPGIEVGIPFDGGLQRLV